MLALSLLYGVAAAQTVPDQSPDELVTFIYQQYVGKKGTDEFNFHWSEPPLVDHLFEPALARAIVKASKSDEPVIDYDPFANAQDFEIKSYTLQTEQKTADRARVAATFVNFGKSVAVHYDLIRSKSGWRIRDITADGGKTSLRKIAMAR